MASKEFPVAIIGMAVRLPGAESCEDFWKLLIDGQDTVNCLFPEGRASDVHHTLSAFRSSLLNEKEPFFTGSFFKSVDKFDADLFSINPKEALFIEPEQRVFLELVWELLEDAGYASKIKGSNTGVYVGNSVNKYKYILTENHPSISHGSHSPFISSRVSYTFDLIGPAMMVATGCSSSLLVVHLACHGLLSKDCEMAIAGGITLDLLPLNLRTDIWNQLGMTGPNVKCRAFETDAKGAAKGEGCGAVLLKPLNKAISDGDFVYAILEASTANQDGHSDRISAPHPVAQANLFSEACSLADISPNSISFFEAHGTGTEFIDPMEVSGITTAFKNFGIKSLNKIPMSSVKANIGHLANGGVGIVALIKVVLCLLKGKIPPNANRSKPNSHINWDTAPVYVNTTLLDWKPNDKELRYASISSLGLLGNNVHAVVREFNDVLSLPKSYLPSTITNDIQILAMAANSQQSLYQFACKIKCYLNALLDKNIFHLRNVCYTVNTSREQNQFSYKAIVYATDFDKMMRLLEKLVDTHFNMEDLSRNDISYHYGNSGFAAFYKYSTVNFKSNYPTEESHNFLKSFLESKAVNWLRFYHNCDIRRVSLVPTYAFDRKRFWPDIKDKPINVGLLQLEHQVRSTDKEFSNLEDRLAETLNDALGINYDWQERGNDDLFALGMDSLIFARVCMKLQSELSDLLLSKFHQNPTFNGLKNLVEDNNCKANIHIAKAANFSDLTVCNVLNEVVAKIDSVLDQPSNLSAAQHRMLVMQEAAPDSTAYVETIAYYTTKEINDAELFENLLEYHPILASRIVQDSKSTDLAVDIKQENLNCNVKLELIDNFEDAGAYLTETIPVIKALSSPLAIFRLLKAEDKLIFVVHMHHIITDDTTLSNVAHDLCSLMNNSARKHLLYNHSAVIENESIYWKSSQMDLDKDFWNQVFLTLPPEVNLAILPKGECIWSDTIVSKAKHISKLIPVNIVKEILRFCNSLEVTEFHFYMACVALVLQRYLGVNELALAVPVTTRTDLHQIDDGLFDNTVLFRLSIDGDCSVKTYIQAVAKSWLEVLAHSHYPFEKVVNLIWEKHEKSVSSFCCILFNCIIQKRPSERELLVMSKHAKVPFSIDVVHNNDDDTTKLLCEWASEIIDDGIAQRIVDSIFEIFEKFSSNLSSKIRDVQVLSFSECSLLKSFSQPFQEYKALNINKSFKNHATNHPDSVAVIYKDNMTTYFQLEAMALLIAFELYQHVDRSVLKRKPIVLITEKSQHAIASFLGVWKAGGHFLPISLNAINSLEGILESVTPAVILVSDLVYNNACILGEQYKVPCININTLLTNPISSCSEFHDSVINKDDLAYVIRTSGSTGTPKVCKVSHKSLGIIANAWKIKYEMTTFQVNVLQWAQISFDVFIGDLIRGLVCSAGTLIICPDEYRLDIPYIIKLIKQHKVTIAETTPQFALQLVQNSKRHDLNSLNILILGSDILQSYIYKKVKEQLNPNQRLLNSYGMTEATIDSSFFEGNVVPKTRSKAIPIGKPLPGVLLYVMDPKSLQPCPVGTIGELYIGGPVLASGDTEILHIQSINCDCLKTNDAAAWLPSGDIELFGRLDRVTKLRGFRISTTEIENKIVTNVIGVEDACVVVLGSKIDNGENKFLCAFIVPKPNEIVNLSILRNQLNGKLPYYMLPDIVHTMETIPLSQNGKVDYNALPCLSDVLGNIKDEQEISTSCTNTESQVHITLKELLSEALGTKINQIHLDKPFMEQGAHSLILLYFATLVKEKTTYDIGITDIFSYPTISSLAAYIQKLNSDMDKLEEKQIKFDHNDDIAITGIGLRLPGDIMSLPQLWQALNEGDEIIGDFPKERIKDFLNFLPSSSSTMYANMDTYQGAFLEAVDHFDCQFFEIAPNEVNYMSPQQRLFLQVATEALAEGRNLSEVKGAKIGVFIGQCDVHYAELNHPDDAICVAGMMPGMVATRVAYQWDLKGPSVLVDTACSSSLMALKQACESIRNGECEGALVGGINVVLYPARKGELGKTGILSPDFHCKPFDKDASGTAVGEGVLCIYTQPLNSALKEKKHIYGVIKSIASNSVGHGNGITAPSSISQQNLIKEALYAAHIKPSDISFVECHATGTILGDRIELSALKSVFNHNLSIGSTKGMFGHLNSAAGLLGVFKILASLMAQQIPPTLHFKNPHPEIRDSSIRVPSATINWNTGDGGRRLAGITSLGLMGTNVHAIIGEQTKSIDATNAENSIDLTHYPLLFCGKNLKQLKKQVSLHQTHIQQLILKSGSHHSLLRLCITVAKRLKDLQSIGVGHNEYRMVITAQNAQQLIMVMKIIMDAANMKSFIQLVTLRSDVYFHSLEYKYTGKIYDCFLINGKIDLELLFPAVADCDANLASCVTMAYYNESRHWLEHSFNKNIKESETDHEDLLSIMERKANETRELIRMLPLGPTQDLRKTQGRFYSAIIVKLFLSTHLSVFLENGKQITLKEAFKLTGFLQKYEKLFFVMIRELFENDLVQAIGLKESVKNLDTFYFKCKDFFSVDPETIANHAVDKYPLWADCFRLPLYCSKSLPDVLLGKISPLSVIYPQGDLNFIRQFDKFGDLLGDVYYNMYMQVIAMYAKKLSKEHNKVRILEVGAGMGYVTKQLLSKLKDMPNIEYWFTDLDKAFVDQAKTTFADFSNTMKFSTFDITKNPIIQGVLESFNIVISYNVIHATENILASVINLNRCLGEDGVLFIIESALNNTWATLAWGILDSWWHFNDYDLRPAEPMLEPHQWETVLNKVGFASVYSFPTNIKEREHVEKFLFLCSAKKMHETTNIDQLEWWECSTQKVVKHNEINNEDQFNIITDKSVEILINKSMVYKALKNIWSELLGVEDIKPDDNFNFLGPESHLAVQMMHLVSRRIGYQLEIADTFAYPTLRALTSFIYERLLEKNVIVKECTESCTKNESKLDDNNIPVANQIKTHGVMLMFSGLGTQKVGMCKSMKDSAPAVEIFNRAKQILGYDILDICTNESLLIKKLKSTEFVQVALFTGCFAKVEQLKYEQPELLREVTHVAGLSVGEFVALVYAGVLKFEDALRFIQKRGEAMENDVQKHSTSIINIFGPNLTQLQEFLENYPTMTISTYLGDNQHTVAGTERECQAFMQALTETDVYSSKLEVIDVRKLRVAGAIHSSHMEQVATLLDPLLDEIKFSKPLIPVIMNFNGQIVEDPLEIKLMSRKQLVAGIKWKQTIITSYNCGVRSFIEVAPSCVLSSVVKKRISECQGCNVMYINV